MANCNSIGSVIRNERDIDFISKAFSNVFGALINNEIVFRDYIDSIISIDIYDSIDKLNDIYNDLKSNEKTPITITRGKIQDFGDAITIIERYGNHLDDMEKNSSCENCPHFNKCEERLEDNIEESSKVKKFTTFEEFLDYILNS